MCEDDNEKDGNDQPDSADALMSRGSQLRRLRELERQDEEERQRLDPTARIEPLGQEQERPVTTSNNSHDAILDYSSYLSHQRYYDDLKHVDYKFIVFPEFGIVDNEDGDKQNNNRNNQRNLVIEQDKSLGKGGLCWDAAFCLGEYLIQNQEKWMSKWWQQCCHQKEEEGGKDKLVSVIELGCGTGLCGMMVAMAVPGVFVSLTDLPTLLPLVQRNVERNFDPDRIMTNGSTTMTTTPSTSTLSAGGDDMDQLDQLAQNLLEGHRGSKNIIQSFALNWDDVVARNLDKDEMHNQHDLAFDVVIGADVVATIYNPVSLAQTIHCMAKDEQSLVFVSFKERLSSIHRQFETELGHLFTEIKFVQASDIGSRNHNPDVGILLAQGKKEKEL